ncbi:MAG: hypothetical protein DLM53_07885 [Candidatus Eremiobacter antarcticus]|nr:MAG: hypothetical protein DLM53_07885 [Candidatus Eremiobacter sp. RRmetagenome_bin22]
MPSGAQRLFRKAACFKTIGLRDTCSVRCSAMAGEDAAVKFLTWHNPWVTDALMYFFLTIGWWLLWEAAMPR